MVKVYRVERVRPADYTVDLAILGEEQFGEAGAILAGNADD
jgi:hypothetical protein